MAERGWATLSSPVQGPATTSRSCSPSSTPAASIGTVKGSPSNSSVAPVNCDGAGDDHMVDIVHTKTSLRIPFAPRRSGYVGGRSYGQPRADDRSHPRQQGLCPPKQDRYRPYHRCGGLSSLVARRPGSLPGWRQSDPRIVGQHHPLPTQPRRRHKRPANRKPCSA